MTDKQRPTYTVRCERSDEWWAISISDVPGAFGQARRLNQVGNVAKDVIAMMLDVDPESFDIELAPVISPAVDRSLRKARKARVRADEQQTTAHEATRQAARDLVDAGLTIREAGQILGVSFQRVSQLIHEHSERVAS